MKDAVATDGPPPPEQPGARVSDRSQRSRVPILPTVLFCVFALASFGLLNLALRDLPVGTAYAVWTGLGAAGTATVGILALGEPADALRIAAISLIVIGAIGLQAVESH